MEEEEEPWMVFAKELMETPDPEERRAAIWRVKFQNEFGAMATAIARQDARSWNDLAIPHEQHVTIWRALRDSFPLKETENKQQGWIISGVIGPDPTWQCDLSNVPVELRNIGLIGVSFTNTRFTFYVSERFQLYAARIALQTWFKMREGNWQVLENLNQILFMHPSGKPNRRISAYYFRYFLSMMAKLLKDEFKLVVHSEAINASEMEPEFKKITRERQRELETMPFSMMPPYVRQRVQNATAHFLMSAANAGSRLHAALSINPATWQEMFARDFPAEYKYYGGRVPFFIRFTKRIPQQPNQWKRAYLYFLVGVKESVEDIPSNLADNALHRKIWIQNHRHPNTKEFWKDRFICYKLMLSFPADFTLHDGPFQRIKIRIAMDYHSATYDGTRRVVEQVTEQDFVDKNPLMLKLLRYVFLGETQQNWEHSDNFTHVIQLAVLTKQDPAVLVAEYQNFCNLMNTCIPILFEVDDTVAIFNVWDASEKTLMIGMEMAQNLLNELSVQDTLKLTFDTDKRLSDIKNRVFNDAPFDDEQDKRVYSLDREFANNYDTNADVQRNRAGQILANEIKF